MYVYIIYSVCKVDYRGAAAPNNSENYVKKIHEILCKNHRNNVEKSAISGESQEMNSKHTH